MFRLNGLMAIAWMLAAAAPMMAQPMPSADPPISRLASPEIAADNRVTFRFLAPTASKVILNADWLGGTRLPMTKDASGVWTLTVGPLRPEMYGYRFIIDGVVALDPNNAETERESARFSSMLMVSGPQSKMWDFQDVPHGTVEQIWYPSPTLKLARRRMYVYLPPDYQTAKNTRYPVLYLLHGGGGDEDAWMTMGRATVILDNLIAAGRIVPMIVVMPNGNSAQTVSQGYGFGPTPSPQQAAARPLPAPSDGGPAVPPPQPAYPGSYPESIAKDIIPFVETTYRVQGDSAHRAIAGLSNGASQTTVTVNNNPGLFAYVGLFSGGGRGVGTPGFAALFDRLPGSGIKLFWTGAGDVDLGRENTLAIYNLAKSKGLPASYKEIPGAHYWFAWRDFLADFAPRLFR